MNMNYLYEVELLVNDGYKTVYIVAKDFAAANAGAENAYARYGLPQQPPKISVMSAKKLAKTWPEYSGDFLFVVGDMNDE